MFRKTDNGLEVLPLPQEERCDVQEETMESEKPEMRVLPVQEGEGGEWGVGCAPEV